MGRKTTATRRRPGTTRRRAVNRRSVNRRRRPSRAAPRRPVLAVTLLVVAAFFLAGLTWRVLHAPVEAVRIAGDLTRVEHEEVRAAVVAALQSAVTGVSDIAEAIRDLDWARDASVRRVWPQTLQVWVERAAITARWGEDRYLTTGGEVVAAPGPPLGTLPNLSGTLSSGAETMRVYEMLSDRLAAHGIGLTSLEETALGGWRLTLDTGATVLLGADDLAGRIDRVLVVYEDALRDRAHDVARLDARYGSGVAVRWRADGERPMGGEALARVAGK